MCLILALAVATSRYLQYWQNGVKLFTHAHMAAWRPDPVIEESLAEALFANSQYDEAFQYSQEACVLRPDDANCHYCMAEILFFVRHQLRDALEQYQLAARFTRSEDVELRSLVNSGEILLELGDYENAEMKFAAALQIDPNNSAVLQLRQRALDRQSGKDHPTHTDAPPSH
jgi:tetratricopeptide (TPR) repeat protein